MFEKIYYALSGPYTYVNAKKSLDLDIEHLLYGALKTNEIGFRGMSVLFLITSGIFVNCNGYNPQCHNNIFSFSTMYHTLYFNFGNNP